MYTQTNAPESASFSPEDNQVFEAARTAAAALAKTFELWTAIARAVELARVKADRIGRRNAFQRILEQQGLAAVLGRTWNSQKSTAHKLLAILDRLPEVETWRAGLSQHQRISWSAPTTVFKHCPVFGEKPDPDHAALKTLTRNESSGINWDAEDAAELRRALSQAATENQRLSAEVERSRTETAELRTRMGAMKMIDASVSRQKTVDGDPYLAALESEIAQLQIRIKELEGENATLKDRIRDLKKGIARKEAALR